jgi:hypothetical protein
LSATTGVFHDWLRKIDSGKPTTETFATARKRFWRGSNTHAATLSSLNNKVGLHFGQQSLAKF